MKFKIALLAVFLFFVFSVSVYAPGVVDVTPDNPNNSDSLTCSISGIGAAERPNYVYNWYINGRLDEGIGNLWVYPSTRTSANDLVVCSVFSPGGFFVGTDSVRIGLGEGGPRPGVNDPPIVRIITPRTGDNFFAFQDINFIAAANDPEGDPLTITWSFGDGQTASGTLSLFHRYSFHGRKMVNVIVSDGEFTARDSVWINVNRLYAAPVNPVAVIETSGTVINEGNSITFDGSSSYDLDGRIVAYEWNFGDGTRASGDSSEHIYRFAGNYVATLTVTDNDGLIGTESVSILVKNLRGGDGPGGRRLEPPVAAIEVSTENAFIGFPLEFKGDRSFDLDGRIVRYEWDLGDGTFSRSSNLVHTFTNPGTYNVRLSVTDNDGLVGMDDITLIVGNVDRGSDQDKQRVSRPGVGDENDLSNFRISRIMPINYKDSYLRGENILLLVKLTNEGDLNEVVDLNVMVPEFNNINKVNNIRLEAGQVKWLMVNLQVPANAAPGLYLARFTMATNNGNPGDNLDKSFFSFIAA